MVAPLRDKLCDFCTWRADDPSFYERERLRNLRACAGHAEAHKHMLKLRDAQEADAKDLLYSLGAP